MKESIILGSNITKVKDHNIKAVLLSLLRNEYISRVELAHNTSLSTTTITNIIDHLISDNLVIEDDSENENHLRRVGRPRKAIRLNQKARYAIGVHIGFGMYRVALVDLRANTISNKMVNFIIGEAAAIVLEKIAQTIDEIIDDSNVGKTNIVGVGIGTPGLVNYRSGINIYSQNLNWENVPIREILIKRLDLPVAVDNNVRLMALAEAFFGLGREVESLFFLYGRIGVGAGIVVNNKIFRGSSLGAGEIGHMKIIAQNGETCRCGQSGCLETLVSVPYMEQKFTDLYQENEKSLVKQYLSNPTSNKIDVILTAAREGDKKAIEVVQNSAYYLGIALANIVNLLNPEMIILGGIFAQANDLIIPKASQIMRNGSFGGLGNNVMIHPTQFGWKAGMIGAASLALVGFFYLDLEDI